MRLSRRALLAATTAAASLTSTPPASAAQPSRRRTGFENLAASGYAALHGQKVGVVTNRS
ncbi:hypothetical protein OHT57_10705 [Streptomyces sp. NBC_00285]|uniref:hypothetical protein n=1 Tax=Streptomyces sp. NBC_00285 TaxID=2975700 RepID=UPI002E2926CC|nr:hypothetical protein [Streptomyces sp. NBC_00285]